VTPESQQHSLKDFVSRLRKLTEGKTPEEIEAWKADIDRSRHPFDYIDCPSDKDKASTRSDTGPRVKEKEALHDGE
jgi:hypothetical protein